MGNAAQRRALCTSTKMAGISIHPDQVLVGRALTAVWMPGRPDVEKVIEEQGVKDHRQGGTNAWPVDMLQPRDVYVGRPLRTQAGWTLYR